MVNPEMGDIIGDVKKVLLRKICQHKTSSVQFYKSERNTLLDIVQRTAELSESNSILVIGPRGAGKTLLVNSVLEELNEKDSVRKNLLQVKLNGLLQTDDRIALKEITRQLQLEQTVGERTFGSFSENLQFLLDALKSGGKHTKSILFLLDEFDMFAQHKNQTLLYNLFDVSQSAMAPVCVLGLTSRLDVIELLEKRVKSRFSHRQLHLLPTMSFNEYVDIFVDYLSIQPDKFTKKFTDEWNKKIIVLSKEAGVRDILKMQYSIDKDIRSLQTLMTLPVCSLNADHPFLEPNDFIDAAKNFHYDSKSAVLHGISVLELCLIIAMKHLTEIYEGEPFNFEMVYKEYSSFATKRAQQMFDKAVVLKAYEHLIALELLQPADTTGKLQKEYCLMNLLVEHTQLMSALENYPACPTDVKQWAHSSLL